MTVHPVVPFEGGAIADIAARMNLRDPNREALEAVAKAFDTADGTPFEVVCDLATAVGKTYLAGGLIEYLAQAGVSNFLMVVPGRTILEKTVANFTAGAAKSVLGGMDTRPVLVTADNFATGDVAAALHDDSVVKLFVFTVQSLIRPGATRRRVREHQEWLGENLYQYLKAAPDLVVLADEHHVYRERAPRFSEAVRDLDAMALVGLTATPDRGDLDKVLYHYPLARAIAEHYVKTPVVVGRKDAARGVEIQLRDGLVLLEAKQRAVEEYATLTGEAPVNAVMFVVAGTIAGADAIAEVLRRPGMFPDDYDDRVLVVTSASPDESLARLDAVESPDSPVRVIVSVDMLKEGWDVKNIFVVCSFRASISESLTEQTLGRGLRLPWGAYTGVDLLDTVEVLSHESYERLLSQAGVLIDGLTAAARVRATVVPSSVPEGHPGTDAVTVTVPADTVASGAGPGGAAPGADGGTVPAAGEVTGTTGELPKGSTGFVLTSVEERTTEAAAQAEAVARPVTPRSVLTLPKVTRTVTARSFSLSDVPETAFRELGRRLADVGGTSLNRKRLDVIADPTAPTGYRLVPTEAETVITAAVPNLPYAGAEGALRDGLAVLDFVDSSTRANLNALGRLAAAVVDGAGGADALAPHLNAAIAAGQRILTTVYRASPEVIDQRVEAVSFGPERINARPEEPNRFGPFSKTVAYTGWTRGLYPAEWFDSAPERTLANLLDGDASVESWVRIHRGELVVEWANGRYSPDFYAAIGGRHYLFEVKSDRDTQTPLVQDKKAAAEQWARFVTDHADYGTWVYRLVPEGVLATARTVAALLNQTAPWVS